MAMQYVVAAYPSMSPADNNWIQNIRKVHDEQFTLIEPHFTIVFPTSKLSGTEMLKHVESLDLDTKPFSFSLSKAVTEENTFQKSFQIHLVADEPIPELVKLHDVLYLGGLESEHRKDLLYVPHITIAGSKDQNTMQKLASELNDSRFDIAGSINEITVSSFDGKKITNLARFHLK